MECGEQFVTMTCGQYNDASSCMQSSLDCSNSGQLLKSMHMATVITK